MVILNARGSGLNVRGSKFKGDVRGNCFTRRLVSAWNAKSVLVVEVNTNVAFKRLLDRYMRGMGIWIMCSQIRIDFMFSEDIVGQRACSCVVYYMVYVMQ